jgi:hypothetical protein
MLEDLIFFLWWQSEPQNPDPDLDPNFLEMLDLDLDPNPYIMSTGTDQNPGLKNYPEHQLVVCS